MTPERPQGVIHDLGYRHYDGPRLGRRHVTWVLFLDSARGAYGLGRSTRSKVMPMILLAIICLPALVIAIVAAVSSTGDLPGNYTTYVLNLQLVAMVYVAGQAPASVSRDLRFRVMSLYFSRPLERIDYVLAKYAALATAVFFLLALPLTILLVGALFAELPVSEQLPDYFRALGGAALTALVLSGIALVIAALTPRRGLGVASVITVLAVLSGVEGAVQAIAVDQNQDTFAGYAGMLSPFTLVHGLQHSLLGAHNALRADPPGAVGALVFLAVTVALIAGSFGALLLRYRKVSVS